MFFVCFKLKNRKQVFNSPEFYEHCRPTVYINRPFRQALSELRGGPGHLQILGP